MHKGQNKLGINLERYWTAALLQYCQSRNVLFQYVGNGKYMKLKFHTHAQYDTQLRTDHHNIYFN